MLDNFANGVELAHWSSGSNLYVFFFFFNSINSNCVVIILITCFHNLIISVCNAY